MSNFQNSIQEHQSKTSSINSAGGGGGIHGSANSVLEPLRVQNQAKSREIYVKSALENYSSVPIGAGLQSSNHKKVSTRVAFTDQKGNGGGGDYNSGAMKIADGGRSSSVVREPALHNKTTDDLLALSSVQDFSKSIGGGTGGQGNLPTHFTSNLSNVQHVNSLEISQINLPQISNSRMSKQSVAMNQNNSYTGGGSNYHHNQSALPTDLHNSLKYGPFQKQFILSNKKAITRMIKQAMLKEDNEPFKGYTEISNATQHIKKHQQQHNPHSHGMGGTERETNSSLTQHYQRNLNQSMLEPSLESTALADLGQEYTHSQGLNNNRSGSASNPGSRNNQSGFDPPSQQQQQPLKTQTGGVNSKVMETWINETLADAEHLDIPGVILKPEHKNPISRYAIDRLTLTNAGIPNETVDRVYRSLFVYSVGFYELIKKLVAHCQRKYSIITAIWKVFSVLLEYCCQSDYRMLISEITNQHEDELQRMEREFEDKCQEFLNNEKILKQNMEVMQKYSEELEKERTNERTLRLKLEEEYMQNSKNHEEEVQLRLKFESKLNSMHSMHRELEIRYKRLQLDHGTAQQLIARHEKLIEEQATEIIHLKTIRTENENRIGLLEEKKATMEREVALKINLVQELERRMKDVQDDSDLTKYQINEQAKELTEQRLRIDVLETQIQGLQAEKGHLQLSLKESEDFRRIFEAKNEELKDSHNELLQDHNVLRQKLVGSEETIRSLEEKTTQQREKIVQLIVQTQEFERQNATMRVELEKIGEVYRATRNDLDDAVERLHLTNRARHEVELRLSSEEEANQALQATLTEKMAVITAQDIKIDQLETKVIEWTAKCDSLEVQMFNNEKLHAVREQTLEGKIEQLRQLIDAERDLKETWVEKFEKEQRDSNDHSAAALIANSKVKDLELELANMTIKYENQCKLCDQLQDQLTETTQQMSEKLVTIDNQRREMHGLKETHTQIAGQKKEYIRKVLHEMDAMRDAMQTEINQEATAKEEYYSKCAWLHRDNLLLKLDIDHLHEVIAHKNLIIATRDREIEQVSACYEDKREQLIVQIRKYDEYHQETEEYKFQMTQLLKIKEQVRVELTEKITVLEKEKQDLQDGMAGMKITYEAKMEVLRNKINELVDGHTKLQSEQSALRDMHDRELRERARQMELMEQEKERLLMNSKQRREQEKLLTPQAQEKDKDRGDREQGQTPQAREMKSPAESLSQKEGGNVKEAREEKAQADVTPKLDIKSTERTGGEQEQTFRVRYEVVHQRAAREAVDVRDQETQTTLKVRKVKGDELIVDSMEYDQVDMVPGTKFLQKANKLRENGSHKLREQLEHINGYPSYPPDHEGGGGGSKTRSQVNLIRMSHDGTQSQNSNQESQSLLRSRASISLGNQTGVNNKPERPSAWQKLATNINSDPYKQMLKSIGSNSSKLKAALKRPARGGGANAQNDKEDNSLQGSIDGGLTKSFEEINPLTNKNVQGQVAKDHSRSQVDGGCLNAKGVSGKVSAAPQVEEQEGEGAQRRKSLERKQLNMESHQTLVNNNNASMLMHEGGGLAGKSKTQIASEKDLLVPANHLLSQNQLHTVDGGASSKHMEGDQYQQMGGIMGGAKGAIPNMNDASSISLDTAQKYHYMSGQNEGQRLQPQSVTQNQKYLQMNQAQESGISPLTLQPYSTIGSEKGVMPQPLSNPNVKVITTNIASGGMPSAYLSNPLLIQQQQDMMRLQQQAQQPGSNKEQINGQIQQLQQQQLLLMAQYQQTQQLMAQQQQQMQAQSKQQFKKPEGNASIKGLIRAAATRHQ